MAYFYAEIQGARRTITQTGSKQSGISGHIRGWISGAMVECYVDNNGKDIVEVSLTSGSQHNETAAKGTVARTVNGKIDYLAKKKDFK